MNGQPVSRLVATTLGSRAGKVVYLSTIGVVIKMKPLPSACRPLLRSGILTQEQAPTGSAEITHLVGRASHV